jgi:hypothetical protein
MHHRKGSTIEGDVLVLADEDLSRSNVEDRYPNLFIYRYDVKRLASKMHTTNSLMWASDISDTEWSFS